MASIGALINFILDLYIFCIIAQVILSWLVAFNVLNLSHPYARKVVDVLARIVEPVMAPVRRYVPSIGGIDISPILVIFAISLLQSIVKSLLIY